MTDTVNRQWLKIRVYNAKIIPNISLRKGFARFATIFPGQQWAKAGAQSGKASCAARRIHHPNWIPAFAGMTNSVMSIRTSLSYFLAGANSNHPHSMYAVESVPRESNVRNDDESRSVTGTVERQREIYLRGLAGHKPRVPLDPKALEDKARRRMSREAFSYVACG